MLCWVQECNREGHSRTFFTYNNNVNIHQSATLRVQTPRILYLAPFFNDAHAIPSILYSRIPYNSQNETTFILLNSAYWFIFVMEMRYVLQGGTGWVLNIMYIYFKFQKVLLMVDITLDSILCPEINNCYDRSIFPICLRHIFVYLIGHHQVVV